MNWFIYSATHTNERNNLPNKFNPARTARHQGSACPFSCSPLRGCGFEGPKPIISPIQPIFFSLLLFKSSFTTAINLLFALPAACQFEPLPPSTFRHTQRNIFGASLVLRWFSGMDVDADVNGWTRTDGGTVNIYIHCPSLALSPKKPPPDPVHPGHREAQHFLICPLPSAQCCCLQTRQHSCTHHHDYFKRQFVLINRKTEVEMQH